MPEITALIDISDATPNILQQELDKQRAWRHITQSQANAIMQNLLPMLPCDVTVAARSPRSIIYVTAGDTRFRIERMGKLNPKPWNPNPRRYVNPWT